ncbi:DUF3939 domain-containing protein [Salinibacillus xinjiangensis]|uniref:DUF3939 domain-containing protein n=1 Tax=Salinibacillus xinjiangensis TaxID=1229268 RepID=A0A6G1X7L9_9BACI|nr:DUF3939 domain-containing protein [Salinibacillus xinjiangensis]
MWRKNKKENQAKATYPIRSVTIDELRQAIRQYGDQLHSNVPLSVIIKDDLTLDYSLLAPFLKCIPQETYYMSKETYELFPESQKQLAMDLDLIQRAVDQYIEQTKEVPVIDGDPYEKVSYFKLEKLNLLPRRPDQAFYITDEEFLVTYTKPK